MVKLMKKKTVILIAVTLLLLLFLFFGGLGSMVPLLLTSRHTGNSNNRTNSTAGTVSTAETDATADSREAYNGSGIPDNLSQEVLEEYLEYMEPANDEYDFHYATDFTRWDLVKILEGRDCSAYEQILGYRDATLEEIRLAADANPNISPKYKEFIYQFACDLRTLYPNVNLAVLRHNLDTLVIDEMTQAEIDKETLSTDSAACYLPYENRVCVAEDLDLSKESDDYIILTHELCHAARSVKLRNNGDDVYDVDIGFYDLYKMGTYAEEGIVTNISYALQGLDNKATFYPMLASYYRIICSCIDYSGEDFFNHGVNYLIEQMDAFMGDAQYAYQVVAMIDAQMSLRYEPYKGVDFRDFQPMYEYIAEMYFKKNITPDMTYEAAQAVFNAFYEDITFNFENMNRKYDIDENTFLPVFEEYIAALGIRKS